MPRKRPEPDAGKTALYKAQKRYKAAERENQKLKRGMRQVRDLAFERQDSNEFAAKVLKICQRTLKVRA